MSSLPGRIEVVDSHTEGEPTRVVIAGWPEMTASTMEGRREELARRDDALWRFDHESLASEVSRVLLQLGRENSRPEVFITEQTMWHALSNRDVFAQAILKVSEVNCQEIKRTTPKQRTVITNAAFAVTEENGAARIDLLRLLGTASALS